MSPECWTLLGGPTSLKWYHWTPVSRLIWNGGEIRWSTGTECQLSNSPPSKMRLPWMPPPMDGTTIPQVSVVSTSGPVNSSSVEFPRSSSPSTSVTWNSWHTSSVCGCGESLSVAVKCGERLITRHASIFCKTAGQDRTSVCEWEEPSLIWNTDGASSGWRTESEPTLTSSLTASPGGPVRMPEPYLPLISFISVLPTLLNFLSSPTCSTLISGAVRPSLGELSAVARSMQTMAWATSTQKCLTSQQKSFLEFTQFYGIEEFPASGDTLVVYAAYLVHSG